MKSGAENRKKTIMAGSLGAAALICVGYAYFSLFGGSSTPAPPPVAPVSAPAPVRKTVSNAGETSSTPSGGIAPGVAAAMMATTSSSLDPTLDERAMLRTESLVYSGSGRNIFSASYVPPPLAIPKNMPSARPKTPVYVAPVPTGPPPPPPIDLKFFGTVKRVNGTLQAFLLQGENVYLAAQGDIVARKYKIVSIGTTNIQVTDLQDNNTQTLPLQLH